MNNFPSFPENSNSLLKKYLTKDIFSEIKNKKTSSGFTLYDSIKSGLENPDSSIGVYSGDLETYKLFSPLLDKIILEYHGFKKEDTHIQNLNSDNLNFENPDPHNKYIISTRIRVARNLEDYPLGTIISKKDRLEVEKKVSNLLTNMTGEFQGKYYPLSHLSKKDRQELINNHFLFKAGDRFLEAAGLNRDWPSGRGIYHNNDKTFLVWINEEDQLRIISMQKGGDIKKVFIRLTQAIKILEKKLDFLFDDHLGYITSCPTNLGTAMRASVHIKLPNLSNNKKKLKTLADKYHLQIRGIHGEHSKSDDNIYDISNRRRLGITEVEGVKDLYNGIVAIIKKEKKL